MTVDETKTKSATDKAIDIAAKVMEWIKRIRTEVAKFQEKLQGWLMEAQQWLNDAQNNSQQYIDRKIKKIADKMQKYHDDAQKWVDDQLKAVSDWMNKQIDSIESGLKRAAAQAELAVLETAGKKKLPADMIEQLAEAAPIPPLPRPSIPSIQVPMPDTSILNIDVAAVFGPAYAAMGQAGAITSADITSTATEQAKNLIS